MTGLNRESMVGKGWKICMTLAGMLFGLILLTVTHGVVNQWTGNFHTIVKKEVYRSAQPTVQQLERYVKQHGIKTVINLRNDLPDEALAKKKNNAEKLGLNFISYPISSATRLPTDKAQELMFLMHNAPKPLLIHCEHGANRTGLAAAIYVDGILNESALTSAMQLSPFYGHLPIKGLGRYAMFDSYIDFQRFDFAPIKASLNYERHL